MSKKIKSIVFFILTIVIIGTSFLVYANNNSREEGLKVENSNKIIKGNFIVENDLIKQIKQVEQKEEFKKWRKNKSKEIKINEIVKKQENKENIQESDKNVEKDNDKIKVKKQEENVIRKQEVESSRVKNQKKIFQESSRAISSKRKGFVYMKEIDMPIEHQKFLYDLCMKRNLNYLKTIALISLESNFNPNLVSKTNDYGYMQINKVNHNRLSEALNTKNEPLDPYINLNWGTYLLEELYNVWRDKNISNSTNGVFSQLDKYVMSSYNKGIAGFKKNGMATKYIDLIKDRYIKLKQET